MQCVKQDLWSRGVVRGRSQEVWSGGLVRGWVLCNAPNVVAVIVDAIAHEQQADVLVFKIHKRRHGVSAVCQGFESIDKRIKVAVRIHLQRSKGGVAHH